MVEKESDPRVRALLPALDDHFKKIQAVKTAQETERDRAATLIAGGALTVSFAFVPALQGARDVVLVPALVTAWVFWSFALIGGLVGHTVSIHAHQWIMRELTARRLDFMERIPLWAKLIEPINLLVLVAIVGGFIAFGSFAYANIDRGSNDDQARKPVSVERCERPRQQEGSHPAATPALVPKASGSAAQPAAQQEPAKEPVK